MQETKAKFFDRTTPPHILTLILMAGMGAMTMNMHLPALNSMTEWFETNYATMQLSLSAFLAGTALIQIIVGPLSDRYGRRPVFIISLTILIAASLICSFAPTVEIFLVARMVQTLATCGMVMSRAVVRDMVPMDRAASMIGYVTMGMTLIPMFAPVVGGYLSGALGWQSIFLFQAVLALIVLILSFFDLGETNANPSASMTAQFKGWPELVGSRRFWGYTLTAAFATGGYFSFLGGAPYVGTTNLGLEQSKLGYYLAAPALGYIFGNFLSGRYSASAGVNTMMISGAVISAIGTIGSLLFFSTGHQSAVAFFAPICLVGFGNGLTLPSANAGIVSVRPHLAGSASGLGGAVTIAGGAGLATITGALLTPEYGAYYLLGIMLTSMIGAILTTLYVWLIDRREGSLAEDR